MGAALRQRCLIHRARNVLAKVRHQQTPRSRSSADYWTICRHARGRRGRTPTSGGHGAGQGRFARPMGGVTCATRRQCVRLLDDRDSLSVYTAVSERSMDSGSSL